MATLMEVVRKLETENLSPEGLKFLISSMCCDPTDTMPSRFFEALEGMRGHMADYPESRTRFYLPCPPELPNV